jgi:type IV pilus assembly protein PilC
MGLSEGLGDYWMILLGIVVLLIVGIRQMAKGESGAVALSKLQLKIPMLGKLVQKQNSASFTRTLATLLASGIPMIDALNIAGGTLKNLLFVQAVEHARDSVSMGSNLSLPLKESGQFPPLVYQMISIGEDTGNIDGMLDKVADYYDEEVKEATEQLMAMMEPAIIIVLAVVVGTIVLSVIMPMSSMYDALENV